MTLEVVCHVPVRDSRPATDGAADEEADHA